MSEVVKLYYYLQNIIVKDMALKIAVLYVNLPQRFRAGDVVFAAPCGHLLRFVISYGVRSPYYPNYKEYYHNVTKHDATHMYPFYLEKSVAHNSIISCDTCDQHWEETDDISSQYRQQVYCHCKKLVANFPCNDCINKYVIRLSIPTRPLRNESFNLQRTYFIFVVGGF